MHHTLALTPHPNLVDGLVGGFVAPESGCVLTLRPDEDLDPEVFECGSLLFSNFWVAEIGHARSFADHLVDDLQAWLSKNEQALLEEGEDGAVVAAVAYWEDDTSGLAMVSMISLTPHLMMDGGRAELTDFPSFEKHKDGLLTVMIDGNDNCPEAFFDHLDWSEVDDILARRLLSLALATSEEEGHDDIRKSFDERTAQLT